MHSDRLLLCWPTAALGHLWDLYKCTELRKLFTSPCTMEISLYTYYHILTSVVHTPHNQTVSSINTLAYLSSSQLWLTMWSKLASHSHGKHTAHRARRNGRMAETAEMAEWRN